MARADFYLIAKPRFLEKPLLLVCELARKANDSGQPLLILVSSAIQAEVLDELLKGCKRPEDLLGDAGRRKELKVRLMERMLGAELTAHLGYEAGAEPPPDQANRRHGTAT